MPFKYDFKKIAEEVDIVAVANYLNLDFKAAGNTMRCACPACNSTDERALQIFPESNSFRCFRAQISGDCISLYAHIQGHQGMYKAAKELTEQFLSEERRSTTPEKKTERRESTRPQPKEHTFDPVAFAAKLAFTDEVAALGFTEEDAESFEIGAYRGKVYFPVRYPDGSISGFIAYSDQGLKLPPKWLPPKGNVVPFPKTA